MSSQQISPDDSGRPRRSALRPARFRDEDEIIHTKPLLKKETRGRKRLAHTDLNASEMLSSPKMENTSSSDISFSSTTNFKPEIECKLERLSPIPPKKEKLYHGMEPYAEQSFDDMPTTSDRFDDINNEEITTDYVSKFEIPSELEFFERTFEQTPYGDTYATVIPHRIKDFFMKSAIIELCANPKKAKALREAGCFLTQPPRLPPITTGSGCYVFYIDGTQCHNAHALSSDDLRPWSAMKDPSNPNSIVIKANVRRHPIARLSGQFTVVTKESGLAEYYLTEYSARLPREERLRKKIFYMTRNNQTYGNVLIIYNYVNEGDAPQILVPNGSEKPKTVYQPVISQPISPIHQNKYRIHQEDMMHPDSFESGFDDAYDDYERDDRTGYYRGTRCLSTGHIYLTVCNKRVATTMTNVLDWILNTEEVKRRRAINTTKPLHPPLVTNDRAYAFFVLGTSVDSFNMTQDEFSPWSSNGTPENPTCFRTKVRKMGVEYINERFVLSDEDDYRKCDYHLVFLYTTNPRNTRLTKKIFYVMDTRTKVIISYALIVYDYRQVGEIPKLNSSARIYSSRQPTTSSRVNYYDEGASGYTGDELRQPKEEDDYQIPMHFMF